MAPKPTREHSDGCWPKYAGKEPCFVKVPPASPTDKRELDLVIAKRWADAVRRRLIDDGIESGRVHLFVRTGEGLEARPGETPRGVQVAACERKTGVLIPDNFAPALTPSAEANTEAGIVSNTMTASDEGQLGEEQCGTLPLESS